MAAKCRSDMATQQSDKAAGSNAARCLGRVPWPVLISD